VRLLLVEDEVELADALAGGLRGEGFEVDVTHDGLDGLWRAREVPYGAIILDILLPGMNGYRVCRSLRDDGITTPILMLTAKTGLHDEIEALDTGADDFLTKPFSFLVLVARVRALLRRSVAVQPTVLEVDDLRLDPAAPECRRGETVIDLTPREAAVLEQLLRTPGQVVTRQVLLDTVWGPDHPGSSNVVDVYIRYLRRKIDEPFGVRTIQTVRGAGYRVVERG
jgi:two-component system, OmpR family, response regulator